MRVILVLTTVAFALAYARPDVSHVIHPAPPVYPLEKQEDIYSGDTPDHSASGLVHSAFASSGPGQLNVQQVGGDAGSVAFSAGGQQGASFTSGGGASFSSGSAGAGAQEGIIVNRFSSGGQGQQYVSNGQSQGHAQYGQSGSGGQQQQILVSGGQQQGQGQAQYSSSGSSGGQQQILLSAGQNQGQAQYNNVGSAGQQQNYIVSGGKTQGASAQYGQQQQSFSGQSTVVSHTYQGESNTINVGSAVASNAQGDSFEYANNQPALITKNFYVHVAPEEEEESQAPKFIPVGRPQKNYKIIFIKTPTYGLNSQVIPIVPATEEKTIVYVLSKKPTFNQDVQLPPVPATEPAKPDVFFIKYNTENEAIQTQQQIQSAFDQSNLENSDLQNFYTNGGIPSRINLDTESENTVVVNSKVGASGLSSSGSSGSFGSIGTAGQSGSSGSFGSIGTAGQSGSFGSSGSAGQSQSGSSSSFGSSGSSGSFGSSGSAGSSGSVLLQGLGNSGGSSSGGSSSQQSYSTGSSGSSSSFGLNQGGGHSGGHGSSGSGFQTIEQSSFGGLQALGNLASNGAGFSSSGSSAGGCGGDGNCGAASTNDAVSVNFVTLNADEVRQLQDAEEEAESHNH